MEGGLSGSGWCWDAPGQDQLVDRLLPDQLWRRIQPLLPPPPPRLAPRPEPRPGPQLRGRAHPHGPHQHPWSLRPARELGCGSATTCWRPPDEWARAGVFDQLQAVLLDAAGRIDLERVSVDSFSLRAL
jgi:transposase